MNKTAGNQGPKIKSDAFVSICLTNNKSINIDIKSKVNVLFGKQIRALTNDVLAFYEIESADVEIIDTGALDFVIAARLEAAIRQVIDTDKEYLTPLIENNKNETTKDRFRFTRLYLPGNSPKLMINAGIHNADGIILDLEDAVAADKKYEARFIVRNALRSLDFYGAERMVRINQIPKGLEDVDYIAPHPVNLFLVPKCESKEQIQKLNERIQKVFKEKNIKNRTIWLMPIIESALGVINAYEIASSADNLVALAIGLEDFTADIGAKRTAEGNESFLARSQVVLACKAAGIQAIDSVFSDISDMEALRENVLISKSLGFDGMGCIHPRQIKVIKENFAPDAVEIEKAKKIVAAFKEATAKGLGVVSLGSKMIDPPVVKRAERTINLAISMGLLAKDWYETKEN